MNNGKKVKSVLFVIFIFFAIFTASAQSTDPWTEYMMPNEVHKLIGEYAGEFNMEISMWMTDGKEPVVIKVNSKHKIILGNRFLEMTQTGDMMGMDYQSTSAIGYNTSSKLFVMTVMTNMGTGILALAGPWDSAAKIVTLRGEITNPADKKIIKVRQQITFIDKNNLLIENFDTNEGEKEKKSIQYKLTRKQ
jgi:Protein of unknown function (DUF1579)